MFEFLLAFGFLASLQEQDGSTLCFNGGRVPPGSTCPSVRADPVYFDHDDAGLTQAAKAQLDDLASRFERGHSPRVLLMGHTDRAGEAAYNVQLSQRYADSVRDHLVARGFSPSAIETQAFGESGPRVWTRDGVLEPRNRRVEIELSFPRN